MKKSNVEKVGFEMDERNKAVGKSGKCAKLFDYLSNPENPWLDRQTLATQVLGYRKAQSLWNLFPGAELNQIEQEALALRRKRCATLSAKVDQALLKKALDGDVAAIKLFYQRYEGWSERQVLDHRGDAEARVIVINKHVAPDPPLELEAEP